jgi:hypothetical protein
MQWECKDTSTGVNTDACLYSLDYDKFIQDCQSQGPQGEKEVNLIKDALNFLQVDVMVHMLYISDMFLPKYLWTWVDQTRAHAKDVKYMQQVHKQILDSWKAFQVTGHGAIELGEFTYPDMLANAPFGEESWYVNKHNTIFLKMNVDEYLQLVRYVNNTLVASNSTTYNQWFVDNNSPQFTLGPTPPTPSSPRRYLPPQPPYPITSPSYPQVSRDYNDTASAGIGMALVLAWYWILAICIGGIIIIATVTIVICCCCKTVCCC